jgi:hypothetical protein
MSILLHPVLPENLGPLEGHRNLQTIKFFTRTREDPLLTELTAKMRKIKNKKLKLPTTRR